MPGIAFTLIILLIHLPYLDLPLFWDEMGQFVPAALDLFRHGLWIPHSTRPNAHPPGLMALLAAAWSVAGYSIVATRLVMLLTAGLTALATFLLAIRLCRGLPGAPAFSAVTLLLFSPVFYTQAMLAQLDLPAALLTVWALIEFLERRVRRAALVTVALVLFKETGVVVPVLLALWLWRERRGRDAVWFLLAPAVLAGWLALLAASTGCWLGNPEFERYNLFYPLHPVRLVVAFLRRAFFLFVDQFHFIGWLAIVAAWRCRGLYRDRDWRVVASVAAAHTVAVTVSGGATLERYLLPVLPLMYIAMAAGWSLYSPGKRRLSESMAVAGLVLCLFWTRPLPSPLENNLAMVSFVRLQKGAAEYLEQRGPAQAVVTAWPLSEALRSPDFGYVREGLRVREIPDFSPRVVASLSLAEGEALALYRRDWNPGPLYEWFPWLARLRARYWAFEGEVEPGFAERELGLRTVARFRRGNLWLAVLEKPAALSSR
ncbi:MAG: ArnT family glycosyltransferase [Bryobacteraceae bacterium]